MGHSTVALGDQKHHQLNSSYKSSFTEARGLGEALPCGHQHVPSVENVNLESSLSATGEMAQWVGEFATLPDDVTLLPRL